MSFDWGDHYRREHTPWDLGRAHPELAARVAEGRLAPLRRGARALVPGCGRGHDALLLARAGWGVTAVDRASEVEESLAPPLAGLGGRFVLADALEWRADEDFELVLDHTFFCALDPSQRPSFGALVREQLARSGQFVSLVFPHGKAAELGGPPFGMQIADLAAALGDGFRPVEDRPVEHSVARRSWAERWASFVRAD